MIALVVLTVIGFILAAAYTILYGLSRPWRRGNYVGRAAWLFGLVVAFTLGLRVARFLGVTYSIGIAIGVYVLIDSALAYLLISLLRARRRASTYVSDETVEVT